MRCCKVVAGNPLNFFCTLLMTKISSNRLAQHHTLRNTNLFLY